VQEAARRKSAGEPNHLLSAIVREWFASRQPLLPIEQTELKVYELGDSRGDGAWYYVSSFHRFAQDAGETATGVVEELLVDLAAHGWILLGKYSQEAQRYAPYSHWNDSSRFFYQDPFRYRVTIPGRRRKEALAARLAGAGRRPGRSGRRVSECIAAAQAGGSQVTPDEGFAKDVADGIRARQQVRNPPSWEYCSTPASSTTRNGKTDGRGSSEPHP
jgi:hypothetical protein